MLDNCEHVIGASAAVADALLRSAPRLTILATSREPLRVPGEVVFRVPSLAIPDPDATDLPDALLDYEAVRLFVERAGAVMPGFVLDETNAAGGRPHLPSARRTASRARAGRRPARRTRADALADRLDDRFRLLRAGSRDRADAAADSRGGARLELRAARGRRARPAAPPGRLLGRLHARGGGGRVRRTKGWRGAGGRPARAAGREVARRRGGTSWRPALPTARDDPRLRRPASRRSGRARDARGCGTPTGSPSSSSATIRSSRGSTRNAVTSAPRSRRCSRTIRLRRSGSARACGRSGSGASSSRRHAAGSARHSTARPSLVPSGCTRCSVTPRSNTAPVTSGSASTTRTRRSRSPESSASPSWSGGRSTSAAASRSRARRVVRRRAITRRPSRLRASTGSQRRRP